MGLGVGLYTVSTTFRLLLGGCVTGCQLIADNLQTSPFDTDMEGIFCCKELDQPNQDSEFIMEMKAFVKQVNI